MGSLKRLVKISSKGFKYTSIPGGEVTEDGYKVQFSGTNGSFQVMLRSNSDRQKAIESATYYGNEETPLMRFSVACIHNFYDKLVPWLYSTYSKGNSYTIILQPKHSRVMGLIYKGSQPIESGKGVTISMPLLGKIELGFDLLGAMREVDSDYIPSSDSYIAINIIPSMDDKSCLIFQKAFSTSDGAAFDSMFRRGILVDNDLKSYHLTKYENMYYIS